MNRLLSIFTIILIANISAAQVVNVNELKSEEEFENILVELISTDSLSSSFIIWIKDSVKPHFHKNHTEQVYVLEGSGEFTLNGETFKISPGDFINIPGGSIHSVVVTSDSKMKVISIQSPQFLGDDRHFIED